MSFIAKDNPDQCADNGKDSSGRADSNHKISVMHIVLISCDICHDTTDEIEYGEFHGAEQVFQVLTEHIQHQHIVEKVADPRMEEHGGKQAPVLAGHDAAYIRSAAADEDGRGKCAPGKDLREQEYNDIDDYESGRNDRNFFARGETSDLCGCVWH